ncbi:MAG: hypothetical protein MJ175_03965, partial [Clostridia bacterium]|nr:hypothetical protein [Clostridia bacterium]
DTWAATDALGRTLPDQKTAGGPRRNKTIGLFFWTWHAGQHNTGPVNISRLMKEHPEMQNDYDHPLWKDYQAGAHHWDEPIYGYYNGCDPWVYRRQAELLADSGVDVVIFDNTNGTFTWREGYMILCEVFSKARAQGVNTPKISFLLPFGPSPETRIQLHDLYENLYKPGLYPELWFQWDGKPLLMAYGDVLDTNDPYEKEIHDFFTFRPGEPTYNSPRALRNGKWTWLSVYPQAVTYREDGTAEQMTVGAAQNWSAELGLTAMNGKNIFGRTHTSKGEDTRPDAALRGANFEEQFEYALTVDPDFIFITGWNEWIAGRFKTWQSVENAFPDEFTAAYSRDLEPSRGELGDAYYYQMVSFIRRYKGVREVPKATKETTIDIHGGSAAWDGVGPEYHSYPGNTFDRDCGGYGSLHYVDRTGRNDLVSAKAARDGENFYFLCRCTDAITPFEAGSGWMRLYLAVPGSTSPAWEHFHFMVEMEEGGKASLLRFTGNGFETESVCGAEYAVSGDSIAVKLPRSALGTLSGELDFKWSDNTVLTGDILDIYVHGDASPGGRFLYRYCFD